MDQLGISIETLAHGLRERLGWPALLGVAALLASLGCQLYGQHQQHALVALAQERIQVQQLADRRASELLVPVAASFTADALLLPRRDIAQVLNELQRLAGLLKFELPQATYALLPGSASEPAAYEIALPLKVRYPLIRLYLTMALNSIPAMSVRELSIRRATPEQLELDVSVRFALFLQDEDPLR